MAKSVNDTLRSKRTPQTPVQFILRISRIHEDGFFFLGTKSARTGRFRDHPFELPVKRDEIIEHFEHHPIDMFDHYWCPNAFSERRRVAGYCLSTPFAWVDVDDADPHGYPRPASIIMETSNGSFQNIWLFNKSAPAKEAQEVSKALVYEHGGDTNGHSPTKYLRIPFTQNHKPNRNGEIVRLLRYDLTPLHRPRLVKPDPIPDRIEGKAYVTRDPVNGVNRVWCSSAPSIIKKYGSKLHPRVRFLTADRPAASFERDRSKCIFGIVAGFYEVGAEPWEIASVLVVNPYFTSKHGINWDRAVSEVENIIAKLEVRK